MFFSFCKCSFLLCRVIKKCFYISKFVDKISIQASTVWKARIENAHLYNILWNKTSTKNVKIMKFVSKEICKFCSSKVNLCCVLCKVENKIRKPQNRNSFARVAFWPARYTFYIMVMPSSRFNVFHMFLIKVEIARWKSKKHVWWNHVF